MLQGRSIALLGQQWCRLILSNDTSTAIIPFFFDLCLGKHFIVSSVFVRISCTDRAISFLLLRNRSISHGVEFHGAGEIPNLRCSSAVEGVIEVIRQTSFETRAMSWSDSMESILSIHRIQVVR